MNLHEQNRQSIELIQQVPAGFQCKEGCSTCCGTRITLLRGEWEHRIKHYALELFKDDDDRQIYVLHSEQPDEQHIVQIVDERGWCPFLDEEKGCLIYERIRPFVCYQYGQHWVMGCAEGVKCPPELEVPEGVVEEFACLVGMRREEMISKEKQREKRRKVLAWRERYGIPGDVMPRNAEEQAQMEAM